MPGRALVVRLAESLDVPLRERNALLLAAGYAPVYREAAYDSAELAPVREALERVLAGHMPYPAVVVDRRGDLLAANDAFHAVVAGRAAGGAGQRPAPAAARPRAADRQLRRVGVARGRPAARERAARPRRAARRAGRASSQALAGERPRATNLGFAVPLRLRCGAHELHLLTTLAHFGTAIDVALDDLRLEAFLPADAATAELLGSLASRGMSETPTIYEWAGGREAFERWLNVFYDLVEDEPELARAVRRDASAREHRDHVTDLVVRGDGRPGRPTPSEHGGYEHMLAKHRGLAITPELRLRFVTLLSQAADDAGLPGRPGVPRRADGLRGVGHPAGRPQLPAGRRRRPSTRPSRAGAGASRRPTSRSVDASGRVASTADAEARPGAVTCSRPPCSSRSSSSSFARRRDVAPAPARAAAKARVAAPTPTPAPTPPPAGKGLAVGVTEFNPNLVAAPAAKQLPEPWNAVRDKLGAIQPGVLPARDRLGVDAAVGRGAREHGPAAGRVHARGRAVPGLGRRPRAAAGARVAPARGRVDDAGGLHRARRTGRRARPSGCERPQAGPRSRPPRAGRAARLPRAGRATCSKAAGEEGAALTYFSPWNEPNHPAFISPQRAECDPAAPSIAPAAYAQIATTLKQTLDAAPGEQQLVLGETAGLMKSTRYVTSVPEFIAGLPKDLVCATTVWSQHAYIGGDDPVEQADAALTPTAARTRSRSGSPRPASAPRRRTSARAARSPTPRRAAAPCTTSSCSWYEDPRVTIAFQYTVREDDKFPTGLVSTDLTSDRPALKEWTAWGGGRSRDRPAPAIDLRALLDLARSRSW